MSSRPINPPNSSPIILTGRVVTMNASREVIADGIVYARNGSVAAVGARGIPAPVGFEGAPTVATRGTIYPGLIDLHNHLSYDALPLWQVPRSFGDRDQWGSPYPPYKQLISGPMQVLGTDPAAAAAIVRYVEVKCLLAGTTTSQGIRLFSDPGIVRQYRGLVRNVEQTGDKALPNAAAHISDVTASSATKFLRAISGKRRMILHLAEGTDAAAHNHFAALQLESGWAITPNLIGVHCVALTAADFAVLNQHGASMVWSPLSNLLLYGGTADVKAAATHQVPIALGPDWSPSGSKNLLSELKVAKLYSDMAGGPAFTDRELVEMVTTTPARMLGWGDALGDLSVGKRADLFVLAGHTQDPYAQLLAADEGDVRLVAINGVPRVGTPTLMRALGTVTETETITVGGSTRVLNLHEATADPTVEQVTLAEATQRLTHALKTLPQQPPASARLAAADPNSAKLAIDGLVTTRMTNRPHLPYRGQPTGPQRQRAALVAPAELTAIDLDPLTTVDDPHYYTTLSHEQNLQADIRAGLAAHAPHTHS